MSSGKGRLQYSKAVQLRLQSYANDALEALLLTGIQGAQLARKWQSLLHWKFCSKSNLWQVNRRSELQVNIA